MNDSKQELQNKIASLEARLADLRQRLETLEQSEQHDAVDHLDGYLQKVDDEYGAMRAYWTVARDELCKLFRKN